MTYVMTIAITVVAFQSSQQLYEVFLSLFCQNTKAQILLRKPMSNLKFILPEMFK